MTDIADPQTFIQSRYQWRSDGYEDNLYRLHRRSGIGDVDGHLELSGSHLFIEQKWWDGAGGRPPAIQGGQRYALDSIRRRSVDVLIIWSETGSTLVHRSGTFQLVGNSNPLACELSRYDHTSGQMVADLSVFTGLMDIAQRRATLRDIIDHWADQADASDVERCPTCGVHSETQRWPEDEYF